MRGVIARAGSSCAVVFLVLIVLVRLGISAAKPPAVTFAILLVFLLLPGLSALARALVAVLFALVVVGLSIAPIDETDIEPALFAFAFVLATGLLREIALRDTDFRRIGEDLIGMKGSRRFTLVSLSVFLAGLTLLIGALQFLAGLVADPDGRKGQNERTSVLRAGLAGYILIPLLSPLAIPFIVVSSVVPDLIWTETLQILACLAVSTWAVIYLQEMLGTVEVRTGSTKPVSFRWSVVLKSLAPVFLTAILYVSFEIRLGDAALIAILVAAIVWSFRQSKGVELIALGVTSARNEAVIIGASVATGLVLLALFPGFGSALQFVSVSNAMYPVFVFGVFILLGLIGVQPALCFILVMPIIERVLTAEPEIASPLLAAAIAGWALNSITSPFGLPNLIAARAVGITAYEFLFSRNRIVLILCPVFAALVLGFASF